MLSGPARRTRRAAAAAEPPEHALVDRRVAADQVGARHQERDHRDVLLVASDLRLELTGVLGCPRGGGAAHPHAHQRHGRGRAESTRQHQEHAPVRLAHLDLLDLVPRDGELARLRVVDLGDVPAVVDEVLGQTRRRGEAPAARARVRAEAAGCEPAGALVAQGLVVDNPARAAVLLVGARHPGVVHDPVQFGAVDVGAGAGAGVGADLDVAAATGAAHDVAGLALRPKTKGKSFKNQINPAGANLCLKQR